MKKSFDKNSIIIMALIMIISLVVGFGIGSGNYSTQEDHGHGSEEQSKKQVNTWTCSMHPQIKLPSSGQCPICGMDLIVLESNKNTSDVGGPNIQLSPYARQLAKVQTVKVVDGQLDGDKELNGMIAWNETLLKTETAWFGGRIEKLHVSYTGQYVKKGQVIAEVYSPELYTAAEEWKQANLNGDLKLIHAVHKKLELLGLDDSRIKELTSMNSERVVQRAQNSGVVVSLGVVEGQYVKTGTPLVKLGSSYSLWVELEVFEKDLTLIQRGQKIELSAENLPGHIFTSKVEFIDPVLNPKTRTIRIRLTVKNKKKLLKPGMLVRGKLRIKDTVNKLYIPESAPLFTGKRALVYVEEAEGVYTNRVVKLGSIINGQYEVLGGLTGGETIVKRGAFKIDAAMQIQANPSMMYPQAGVVNAVHDRSSMSGKKEILHQGDK
jgi:membrane fusion protein, copper/silver efflux system